MTGPITRTLTVACDPATAFRVFTREIGSWWPTEQHSLHPGAVAEVVWEEHEGGAVYEVSTEGERADWATVVTWEPPSRLVIAWHVNPERAGTEIDVRFSPVGDSTLVELEHRGFDRVADGAEMRESYGQGWGLVLGRFASALPQPADTADTDDSARDETAGETASRPRWPAPGRLTQARDARRSGRRLAGCADPLSTTTSHPSPPSSGSRASQSA